MLSIVSRSSCLLALTGLAAALPAPNDAAQVLFREGDTLSNGETALFFGDYRIRDNGAWAAVIGTDGPAVLGFGRELLLREGNVILAEGDALPSGAIVQAIAGMEFAPNGQILAEISILPPGATDRIDAIWTAGITVLRAGPIGGGGFPPGTTLDEIVEFEVTETGELLLIARISGSTIGSRDAVLRYEFGAGAPVVTLEALSGTPVAPFADPIRSIPAFARSFDAVSDGSYVLPIDLDRGPLPVQAGVAGGVAVFADGDPVPGLGADWDLVDRPSMCAGLGGSYAVGGTTRTPGSGQFRGTILKDGATVAREGSLVANGNLRVLQFSQPAMDMAETGELFYQVPVESTLNGAAFDALMLDSFPLLGTGTSTASGQTIEGFGGGSDSLRVSPDGNHVLFHALLPGNVEAVCAVERSVGGPTGCTSEPNSTGSRGQLVAFGSSFIDANDLQIRAFGLPQDSFGYLCVSITPGFIANPGGSVGNLCLGGAIGRFVDQVQSSGSLGWITTTVDLTSVPQPTGPLAAQPGEVWGFQMWHRDSSPGGPVSNWTDPWAIRFR
ncbi:MAG: hypothetical protein AAF726_16160 [Planctomycetota bacterium]